MRLTNFNVETFCTPSRTALLTGRYGIRSGTLLYRAPVTGMTLWEVTIAELLKPLGYATAMYGKWHVGDTAGRAPTAPGLRRVVRDSALQQRSADRSTFNDTPQIWEGRAGEPSRPVKPFNLQTRATLDREVTERAVEFMGRSRQAGRPFFAYVPFSLIHFPTLPHPEFAGTTGAGDIGGRHGGDGPQRGRHPGRDRGAGHRARHDRDLGQRRRGRGPPPVARHRRTVARVLPHGPGRRHPHALHDPLAGAHPRRARRTRSSTASDVLPTLAAAVGVPVPSDRAIDGVNQLPFLEGRQERSNRESFIYFAPPGEVRAVKWRDWKLHYVWQEEPRGPIEREMRLFNLRSDPKEETDVKDFNPGVIAAIDAWWASSGRASRSTRSFPWGRRIPTRRPAASR